MFHHSDEFYYNLRSRVWLRRRNEWYDRLLNVSDRNYCQSAAWCAEDAGSCCVGIWKSTFVLIKTIFVKCLSEFGYSSSHGSMHISDKLSGWEKLFLLKTTLSREKQHVLHHLCMESELMNKISYDVIIDNFANRKPRKKKL